MKQLISCLEEEVSLLRKLLSNLKVEENALIARDQNSIKVIIEERSRLCFILKKTKEGRKKLSHQMHSFKDDPSIQTLIHQVESLEVHITKQQDENKTLRKRSPISSEINLLLKKNEMTKKKRHLLLDEENG